MYGLVLYAFYYFSVNKGEKEYDDHLPKMCLSFANLKEKKGKYNGCNWEMVKLEVVPKETQDVEGRQACVLYFCSRLFLRSGHWLTLSGGNKAASVRGGSCGRHTKDTCSHLLPPGGPSLRGRGEQRSIGSRSLVTAAQGARFLPQETPEEVASPARTWARGADILFPKGT